MSVENTINYLKALANGKSPLNDEPISMKVINSPEFIRYTYSLIDELTTNNEKPKKTKKKFITKDEFVNLKTFDEEVHLSFFVKYLKEQTNLRFTYKKILLWLISEGFLKRENEKNIPTEKGVNLGLRIKEYERYNSQVVYYNKIAQRYILDNYVIKFVSKKD